MKNRLDIQSEASKYFNLPKSQQIGLEKAIKRLDIQIDMKFHRALNDDIYTAEVFKTIKELS